MSTDSGSSRSGLKPTQCLDAEEHSGECITDVVSHYLGCIEIGSREEFYLSRSPSERKLIENELRRIQYLRHVLEQSDEESDQALISYMKESMEAWKTNNVQNFEAMAQWRTAKGKNRGETKEHDPNKGRQSDRNLDYDPIKDFNAYVIQFDKDGPFTEDMSENEKPVFQGQYPNQKVSVEWLLRGKENYLDKSRCKDSSRVRYFHFPANNMEWVQHAMARYYNEPNTQFDNEYRRVKTRNQANTLLQRNVWRGQLQGRGSLSLQSRHLRPLCEAVPSGTNNVDAQPANLVLYMPYLHWELDRQRKNFSDVIDKISSRGQENLKNEEERLWKARRIERQELHPHLMGEGEPAYSAFGTQVHQPTILLSRSATPPASRPLSTFIDKFLNRQAKGLFSNIRNKYPLRHKDGRLKTSNRLGQLLYDAFRLYETINNFRDRKLVDKYLHNEPPMHTRRTLDQAYYWTLPNTRARDRDQVVYRGTSADPRFLHHYRPDEEDEAERWTCRLDEHRAEKLDSERMAIEKTSELLSRLASRASAATSSEVSDLPVAEPRSRPQTRRPSKKQHFHKGCLGCREAIQKVPRIVMVDQLWMWILDDSTIISFFPKRYGVNRQDMSGVHKAIRQRFANIAIPGSSVRSAYDVALIIIDECSNLFFERTKLDPRQPQVVDVFSEAIGNMAQKSTISFQHLWHWANELAKAPTNRSSWVDLSQLHVALLNITPEGKLQRETKDIIEELDIMLYISKKQMEVLKSFERNVSRLLDPTGAIRESEEDATVRTSNSQSSVSEAAEDQRRRWKGFMAHAKEVLQEHEEHMEELRGLQRSAEHVNRNLDHLLALKQQQASVLQAWQAIRHGEEAVKQGRAIMIFTVITIVFLPLAFMAAIFGMNNEAFKGDKMNLGFQLQLMFGISVAVIIFVIVFAFSNTIRSLMWCLAHIGINYFLVKIGLYSLWLCLPEGTKPDKIVQAAQEMVRKKKEEVRMQVRRMKKRQFEARKQTLQNLEKQAATGHHKPGQQNGANGGRPR